MRLPAVFTRLTGPLSLVLLLGMAPAAEPAPPWNVGYRHIDARDSRTGESFPVALWYPTPAAPARLYMTGSLSMCRLPALLCRWVAFEMPVANDAPLAAGRFGMIVISHG